MRDLVVSVVILNYNYARFLPRSIDSVLAQDWPNVELVVVDDCSTDSSREVIARYGDRIVPVLKPQNGGHGAGMNSGFAASRGDLVMFLDADDYLYPQALRRVAERAEAGVAQYQFRLDLVDAEGRVLDAYPPREFRWEDGDVTEPLLRQGRYGTTVTSGLVFSRAALDRIMPMDAEAFRQGGDGYLVTVAPLYGRVKTVDEVLGAYCQHGGNHSQFATAVSKRARWRVHHDQMRHRALLDHAARLGLAASPELWRNDALHLEERIASLLLAPQEHPEPADRRQTLAQAGYIATQRLPMSAKRRRIMQLWWRVLERAPAPMARWAVQWKLQAATRPWIVRMAAKALRRAAGGPRPVLA